jgi:hypothetical protein
LDHVGDLVPREDVVERARRMLDGEHCRRG